MNVVLTRAVGGSSELPDRLRAAGLGVEECPLVRVEPVDGPPVRGADYDWLLLTSRNAVPFLGRRIEAPLPRVAVVGPSTAEAVRALGVEPALVARVSTQEGLAAELPQPAGRVLFAGAEGARDVLARRLGADFLPLYRTVAVHPARFPDGDLVVLASPSAARSFAALGREIPCVSIGPVTSAEARRLGLRLLAEAASPRPEAVAGAVKLAASSTGSSPS